MPYTTTKVFFDFPCAHRQWRHAGHCKYIHGYDREFVLHFSSQELTPEGFVIDFSKMAFIKEYLISMFDHTLLISEDDPEMELFKKIESKGLAQLQILPSVSCEYCAKIVLEYVNKNLPNERGIQCYKVECRENHKNSASYSLV